VFLCLELILGFKVLIKKDRDGRLKGWKMISIYSEVYCLTVMNNASFPHFIRKNLNLVGIRNPLKEDKKAFRAF
jgi:hypothetical protein